jgi:Protein of unknown function (DUF2000)
LEYPLVSVQGRQLVQNGPGLLPEVPLLWPTRERDRDNRAAVRTLRRADLDLIGVAIYGPRGAVDKIIKGARMAPVSAFRSFQRMH